MTYSSSTPKAIIDQSDMTWLQVFVVLITILLNAMDGFDVVVIAVSANGIAAEWGIDRAGLGFVLTAELAGMAIGSVLIGGAADKVGRRLTLLSCLGIMSGGMLLATTATNPFTLCIWRVLTGLGIGGMLSCTNAVVAEFSNLRNRAFCISLMVIGYPLGGTLVSFLAESILLEGTWRVLFYIGAAISGVLIPVVYFLVPESILWLSRVQPANALERVNTSLGKLGHPSVRSLPEIKSHDQNTSVLDIFSPQMISTTLIVLTVYSFHMFTFYFLLKWAPTIVTDFGFNPALASGVLTWTNLASAAGGFMFGVISKRVGLQPLTIATLFISFLAIIAFGRAPQNLDILKILAAIAGFCTNAAISGIYSIIAISFPTHLRATGTGFVIGVGRGGAVVSPIIAGYLFDWQIALPNAALIMASGSLIAAIALLFLFFINQNIPMTVTDTVVVSTKNTG